MPARRVGDGPPGAPTQAMVDALADPLAPGRHRRRRRQLPLDRRREAREELAAKGSASSTRCLRRRVGSGERLRAHGRRRQEHVATVQPIFDALKPEGEFGSVHAGKVGAGHFAKMVHNGIEYALMQAYAEGWEL